ncbi:MAG: Uma2 family endonuclease [Wenzhouxiangellaceae bacterium]
MVGEILGGELHATPRPAPKHAREGVSHLWLVDPDARTLEVYALQESARWLLLETLRDDDDVRQPPFDAIEFPLSDLWADPPSEARES